MKTLYLTRHGETMFNRQHRIQGWCDSPLTEHGRDQAREMGAILRERDVNPDATFCSTAERAGDTLELLLGALNPAQHLSYTRLKGLREMFYGDLEAQQDFLAENDPEACRTYYLQLAASRPMRYATAWWQRSPRSCAHPDTTACSPWDTAAPTSTFCEL